METAAETPDLAESFEEIRKLTPELHEAVDAADKLLAATELALSKHKVCVCASVELGSCEPKTMLVYERIGKKLGIGIAYSSGNGGYDSLRHVAAWNNLAAAIKIQIARQLPALVQDIVKGLRDLREIAKGTPAGVPDPVLSDEALEYMAFPYGLPPHAARPGRQARTIADATP